MILDTNAVSALAEGDREARRVILGPFNLYLPTIVLGEFEFGMLGSSRRETLRVGFARIEQRIIILPVDRDTSLIYAGIKHGLKRSGRPIPENDIWIAALALQHDQPILSRDAHFNAIDGVRRVGW
jgi:tRNA(fMet)-specific endonuclease VapC